MCFPDTGWPEDEAVLRPALASQCQWLAASGGGIEHGYMCPIEVGKRFGAGELRLFEIALEPQTPASIYLQVAECQQELGVRPLLLHRLILESLPVVEHMGERRVLRCSLRLW